MTRAVRFVLLTTLALSATASPRAQAQSASPAPVTSQAELQRAFDQAIAKWRAKRPAEYEFTEHATCFCVGVGVDVAFHVKNDESAPAVAVAASVIKANRYYDTIDKIFDVVQRTISRGPYRMSVEYDETWGYVKAADMDPLQFVADDELGLRVSGFKVVQ